MSRIMNYTKEVCNTFVEVNGKLKINTTSVIGRRKLSDRKMNFLAKYADFVLNSGVISDITKIYLNSIENNPYEAIRVYNATHSDMAKYTSKQVSNHLYYDTKRLLELFDDDMIFNIVHKEDDITIYEDTLDAAINKKIKKNLLQEQSVLKLSSGISSEVPDEDEMDQFFMLYAPYTKKMINKVSEELPVNVVKYINYIVGKKNLSDDERKIINRLKSIDDNSEIE